MVFAIYPIEMGIITTGGSDRRSWSRERNKVSWGLDAANLFSPWVHCSLLDPVPNSVDPRKYCWELFFKCVDLRTDRHYTTCAATLVSNLTGRNVLGNCDRDRTQPVKIALESIDIRQFAGEEPQSIET
jgi:hypothetical protein